MSVHKHLRQLYVLAISAKRYGLFNRGARSEIEIRKALEHGLGQFLNPLDPEDGSKKWIEQVWLDLIYIALGRDAARPKWTGRPAVARITTSSPLLHRPFARAVGHDTYERGVKPMNFLLSVSVLPGGHPQGVNPKRFHLVTAFSTDPRRWPLQQWIDVHSGRAYGIATSGQPGGRLVRVKSYGEVLDEYSVHPETKSCGGGGHPCNEQTKGLLRRRPVHVNSITLIGKESNQLEEVRDGLVHDLNDVLETYGNPEIDLWETHVRPVLRRARTAEVVKISGLHQRTVRRARNGKTIPRKRQRQKLLHAAVECASSIVADQDSSDHAMHDAERLLRSEIGRQAAEELERSSHLRSRRKRRSA